MQVEILATQLEGVPVWFVKNPTYFEGRNAPIYITSQPIAFYDDALRFSFFSEACSRLMSPITPVPDR